MKLLDVIATAFAGVGRAKLRTFLTSLAIGIAAFTLTMTSGIGAGINKFVTDMVSEFGSPDEFYVQVPYEFNPDASSEGPEEYVEESSLDQFGYGSLTEADIEDLEALDHILEVTPMFFTSVEYLEVDDTKYSVPTVGMPLELETAQLEAGSMPDPEKLELIVPLDWVEALGAKEPEDAVGTEVTLGIMNEAYDIETLNATVSGVAAKSVTGTAENPTVSIALNDEIFVLQASGIDREPRPEYFQAVVKVDDMEENGDAVLKEIEALDLTAETLEDQLGMLTGIIDGITWIFNGFALIALLAASFGIINTLLMAVQERTREIGLMKALGMTSGRIFLLFSTEAVVIGLIGSIIGMGLGLIVGLGTNFFLVSGPLSDVPGLTLFAVKPLALLTIVGLILVIAFLAGTLPARRAALKDPITALRHE